MKFPHLAIALALSAVPPSASAATDIFLLSYPPPRGFGGAARRAFSSRSNAATAATSTSTWSDLLNRVPRGGADSATVAEDVAADSAAAGEEKSLDEKVREAMKKYGLNPDVEVPADDDDDNEEDDVASTEMNCEGGVCEIPSEQAPQTEEDINDMTDRIATELDVDRQIVLAALGATATGESDHRRVDEALARELIVAERDAISGVTEDCDEVKQLVSEGHDPLLSRRALAFADMQIDNARAILLAEQEDEDAEKEAQAAYEEEQARLRLREEMEAKKEAEANMKEIKVDSNFDPTQPAAGAGGMSGASAGLGLGMGGASANTSTKPGGMPGPAKKEDVVFDITTDQIQEIIMESPVPVLLDIYADWCGPCKALAPALEQMAVKAGGMFRLVKLNSDNERSASQALEVKALPTVFGIRDGKIVNMFQGMPRDEEMMRNFMMGLMVPGTEFNPPVTSDQKKEFAVLSTKLTKVAGSASFPFSARERLQDRTVARLDELVQNTNMADAEEAAKTIRTLFSNIIRDPYETTFRRVNLANKVIAARVASQPPAVAILKSVGFGPEDGSGDVMVIGKGKKAVNVAPLLVARDCIDKWIDKNRYEIAKAARLKKDELERARLAAEVELEDEYDSEDDEEEEPVDPDACTIRLRIDGKKKVHDLAMRADDTLSGLVDKLPGSAPAEEEVQITCTARRLIVKSSDTVTMNKTLRELKLMPSASVVVKIGSSGADSASTTSSLAERAKARQERKKGEHTMASIGIYSKDDNAKGELIDGGGGVWYEHDITSDDEGEGEQHEEPSSENGEIEDDDDEDMASDESD